ncbi:MAG: hypothetical protein ACHQQP_03960, partial [Gemmatimonadales bacterium]
IAGQSALAQQTVVAPADSPQLAASDSSRSTGDTVRYVPLTLGQKAALYSSRTFSARAILGASYAAGLAQWRHTPKEWGTGMSGYGRRDAAAYGGLIVGRTAAFGFGALLHEDPRFFRSTHNGFVPRTKDVLRSSLTVRTDDGGSHIAWSRAAAALVTGFAVNSWEPRRMHSTHHALMLSLAGFLSYGTATFTQEFTPDVRRYVFHHLHIDHQP